MGPTPSSDSDRPVDPDRVAQVVSDHPVRCAILYGSRVTGTATAESDVDIAVAFEDGLSAADRLNRRLDLIVDFVEALGTDDVDVADLDSIRPSVGSSALKTGRVLFATRRYLLTSVNGSERPRCHRMSRARSGFGASTRCSLD